MSDLFSKAAEWLGKIDPVSGFVNKMLGIGGSSKGPSVPPVPPAPRTPDRAAAERAAQAEIDEERRRRQMGGRGGTILTSGLGASGETGSQPKTLLGSGGSST